MPPQILALLFNKYTAALVVVLGLLGYIHSLRSEVSALEDDKTKLLFTVEEQKVALVQIQKDVADIVISRATLEKQKETLATEKKKLETTLYRENRKKKSLEELAIKKTKLVEKLVNNATKKVFDCFETISAGGDCK